MYYNPKTGKNAGKKNFQDIKNYLEENPQANGVQIATALNLSKVTVCNHLKKLQLTKKL